MTTATIQKTAKPYKAMIALSQLSIFITAPLLFFNHHGALSACALLGGIAIGVVGKIGAWWKNG